MGGGRDTLSGGDGNDTFQIAAASDITSGVDLAPEQLVAGLFELID